MTRAGAPEGFCVTLRPTAAITRALVGVALAGAAVSAAVPATAVPAQPRGAVNTTSAHVVRKPVAANKKPAHLSPFSARLVAVMNATRKSYGLRPLVAVASIGKVASGWSSQLASADHLSHNPQIAAQIQRIFPNWHRIEENVGAMTAASPQSAADGQRLAEAYLRSPTHRENILDANVSWIGVANATGGGAVWNTIDFVG